MTTPTPMKHTLSQQGSGRTPSQTQHGVAATPPVSTPFSMAHAALSPHGSRLSPQAVKKSPAISAAALLNHPTSNSAVSFDSPSAAAAFSHLQLSDLDFKSLGGLAGLQVGRNTEDEKAKRLDEVISILSQTRGYVSEAGLERLAHKLGLECMWDEHIGGESKRTLIIAGSALELLIGFTDNIVQSLALAFPESSDSVNKHAEDAGNILLENLKLQPGQSPLTKQLDSFSVNFERLAILDKLSIASVLNLYEAIAGVYDSLSRLHQWELQKVREDASLAGRSDEYLRNIVLCTRSGTPAMNARGKVGMRIDYWKDKHLQPPTNPQMAAYVEKHEKIWGILVGCAPINMNLDVNVHPVRVSHHWIPEGVERPHIPGDLQTGPMVQWLEPQDTLVPPDPEKAGDSLLGPRLPSVTFSATFDPPMPISLGLWEQLRSMGIGIPPMVASKSFDLLVFPMAPGDYYDPSELREIHSTKDVKYQLPGSPAWNSRKHANSLYIYKPVYGKTLTEASFSHPQQLIAMLPYLRQYAFLSTLLENSFKEDTGPKRTPPQTTMHPGTLSKKTTTNRDEFNRFMSLSSAIIESPNNDAPTPMDITSMSIDPVSQPSHPHPSGTVPMSIDGASQSQLLPSQAAHSQPTSHFNTQVPPTGGPNSHPNTHAFSNSSHTLTSGPSGSEPEAIKIDINLTMAHGPRLQIAFPFRASETAIVVLEIRENGQVHVESQNVLGERNRVAPNGRERRPEDLGKMLETLEDIGKWVEFVRTRWA
ncbi:mediator of RNA polymerase II transcription subunit 1-domain-containing protein [Pseudoneurospora amorphoporcata]|uniref:Mediator of RNA polymerase II transcription subunit 1 n=1 Tax=Pseudoneurospora amorphoporcata TaxID=241081 RepID=A0AAN6P5B0_9PEZI|nr:mediator of RNA polymerase II transcription subunit 1-domain-containing protein [Pseudoneurospora amorphoporcata]